jgi:hypothetical protein
MFMQRVVQCPVLILNGERDKGNRVGEEFGAVVALNHGRGVLSPIECMLARR